MNIYEKIIDMVRSLLSVYFKNSYTKQPETYTSNCENNKKLELIKEIEKRGFDSPYELELFDIYQLNCILKGLKDGLDVSVYARPDNIYMKDDFKHLLNEKGDEKDIMKIFNEHDFSWSQKLEIIRGFEAFWTIGNEGVKIYADPKLDWQQMREIRLDLTEIYNNTPIPRDFDHLDDNFGLDLSSYIKPEYSEEEINKHIIHERLCEEKAEKILSKYNFRWYQQVEILKGIDENVDVSLYAIPIFNESQMREIRLGLEKGLDVSIYAEHEFDCLQMKTIRKGLEEGLDVSIYADSKIDYYEMEIMRICLERGLDISTYANPRFNNTQLREIMWGLQKEVDVSKYVDPKLSWEQMSEIRNKLQDSKDIESVELLEKEQIKDDNEIFEYEDDEELEL